MFSLTIHFQGQTSMAVFGTWEAAVSYWYLLIGRTYSPTNMYVDSIPAFKINKIDWYEFEELGVGPIETTFAADMPKVDGRTPIIGKMQRIDLRNKNPKFVLPP